MASIADVVAGIAEDQWAMVVSLDPEEAETQAIHALIDFAGADVLEVGCGDGRMTWRFAERAHSVLALDPDRDAIASACAATPDRLHSKLTFRVDDITTADVPHAAFDVAALSWSLC